MVANLAAQQTSPVTDDLWQPWRSDTNAGSMRAGKEGRDVRLLGQHENEGRPPRCCGQPPAARQRWPSRGRLRSLPGERVKYRPGRDLGDRGLAEQGAARCIPAAARGPGRDLRGDAAAHRRVHQPGADRRLRGALRAVAGVVALLVFVQATLAGHILVGNATALRMHEMLGTEVLRSVALLQALVAVLVWRPGRGPAWPIGASALVFAAIVFQITYGFSGRLALHIPLGVAILVVELALALRLPRTPPPAPPRRHLPLRGGSAAASAAALTLCRLHPG